MKATLDHLVSVVQNAVKHNVAQVILSSRNIHDRAETLRNTPSLLENQVEGGTRAQSKTGEELANLARACIDSECEKIDEELQKLRHVEAQLNAIVILVAQKLPAMVNMVLAQTENSEKRMQELAQFLQVDFTMVLDKVKTMSTHAPQQISRLIQASSRDLPGPSKSKSGDGANTYAQLNVDEFQDVEYHLEFDPIAAAQGEYRRLRPLSPVRSEQSCNLYEFQQGKNNSELPQKVVSSPSPSIQSQSQDAEIVKEPSAAVRISRRRGKRTQQEVFATVAK
ncbi:hypothetical protein Aduo_008870 [Ancylostoma duodenale]